MANALTCDRCGSVFKEYREHIYLYQVDPEIEVPYVIHRDFCPDCMGSLETWLKNPKSYPKQPVEQAPVWVKPTDILPKKSGKYIVMLQDKHGNTYTQNALFVKDHPETPDGFYSDFVHEYGHICFEDTIIYWLTVPTRKEI